jgi:hypothetical protein
VKSKGQKRDSNRVWWIRRVIKNLKFKPKNKKKSNSNSKIE